MIRSPGQQPSSHVFMPDVVAGFDAAILLAHFPRNPFLVGNVRLDCVRNEEIRAPAAAFRKLRKAPLCLRPEPDAERRASCVRHEHILARARRCERLP
jgi:hypothetical protein